MTFPSDHGVSSQFVPAGVNRRRFLCGIATAVALPMFESFVARDLRAAANSPSVRRPLPVCRSERHFSTIPMASI